jgi:hypothetical protein
MTPIAADFASSRTSDRPRIMLVGLGDLGSAVLEFLARQPGIGPILVASRNAARGERRVNLARAGATAQGFTPSIRFAPLDIDRPGELIELATRERPDIVLSTATRQTWWLADLLPPEHAARLRRARFGVWLPLHLGLTLKLMRELRAADYRRITLTAPFPDVVNAVLDKVGLAPDCGVGNVEEIATKVRLMAAGNLQEPAGDVRVTLVAHHALVSAAFDGSERPLPPYFLRVSCRGKDVTEAAGGEQLLRVPYNLPPGPAINFLTAGCTVRLIRALGQEAETALHAPAPAGLAGGYPLLVSASGIQLAAIDGLTHEQAVAINEASHRFDGIERIEADGTVLFCREDVEVLREALGYEVSRLKPQEADGYAEELAAKLREFARRAGVDLDRAWEAARLS